MGEPNCVNGKCLIQGGTFTMGSPADVGDGDEHPQKQVTVTTFRVGQTEVSIGDYKRHLAQKSGGQLEAVLSGCASGDATRTIPGNAGETMDQLRRRASQVFVSEQCGELKVEQVVSQGLPMEGYCGQTNGMGDDYPVVCLTMPEKEAYCHAQGGELMTAAQFEYAARFDEQDAKADQLVVYDNGHKTTAPVRSGYRNKFGVFNLFGNVWESMRDAYDAAFYSRMPGTDPYNPLTDASRQTEELRGGSFLNDARNARAAARYYVYPDSRYILGGFRCVWPQDSK